MNLPKDFQRGIVHVALILVLIITLGLFALSFAILPDDLKLKIGLISSPKSGVASVNNTPYISANGTGFVLKGQEYQFVGINAYELATLPGSNAGCGSIISDVDGFFSSLRPNSVVRFWAYQGAIATNVKTKQLDWTQFDKVVNSARDHNQRVIPVLGGQSGQCDDGHWKDRAWYSGGYNQSYNDDNRGLAPLSFLNYAKLVANRYKDSTGVAFWELVSEPEPADCPVGFTGEGCYARQTCFNEALATQALRSFYDFVGGQMKQIDTNHLIESGVMGSGQCGGVYLDYSYIHQSPGIDIASFHDYGHDDVPIPGDPWNGLGEKLTQMKEINKPLIIGEAGMTGHATVSCTRLDARRDKFKAKMDAQFAAGVAGYIPWDYTIRNQGICTYDINPGDPVLTLLHDYPAKMNIPLTTPMPTPTLSPISHPTPASTSGPIVTLGGLGLSSYCRSLSQTGVTLNGMIWSCVPSGTTINMTDACIWQYKNPADFARQVDINNPFTWTCFGPKPD